MEKMGVSVIIPTHNRVYCLERAINSVLKQKYSLLELIIIDDGSSDNTKCLVDKYLKKDNRVKYFYTQCKGVSAARNLGIQKAEKDFIAFLDSDDEWLLNKLLYQIKAYEEKKFFLCHTDEIWIRKGVRVNQMKKHKKYGGNIYRKCLPLCCISPSSVMIKKELFEMVGYFDESLPVCEDYDLWLRICSRYEVTFIPTPLIIKYGGHDDQLSSKSWGNDEYRIIALKKILDSSMLSEQDKMATIDILRHKSLILSKGFAKYNNQEKSEYYQKLSESLC